MAYTGGFGVDTTGIDFGDTFLPSAGSPTYGTYDFLPRDQFPENFYNAQSNPGGGFFNQFGQFVNKAGQLIPQIGKIAGAVGDIARIGSQDDPGIFNTNVREDSTRKIDTRSAETFDKIRQVFKDIRGLTGVSTEDAAARYVREFGPTMDTITAQGRSDLREDPDISKQYAQLNVRVPEIQKQYSNLNPRFAAISKAADAVASINPDAIKNVMTLGPAYKEQYSYEDPESQKNIYGRRNAIGDIASFYANDPNLNQYMVSAGNTQELMNYS